MSRCSVWIWISRLAIGPVGIPDIYTEAKFIQNKLLTEAYSPIVETLGEFGKHFGRSYKPIETYKTEDADVLLLTMGSISETAMSAIDRRAREGPRR